MPKYKIISMPFNLTQLKQYLKKSTLHYKIDLIQIQKSIVKYGLRRGIKVLMGVAMTRILYFAIQYSKHYDDVVATPINDC